jgi:hypothetical protein
MTTIVMSQRTDAFSVAGHVKYSDVVLTEHRRVITGLRVNFKGDYRDHMTYYVTVGFGMKNQVTATAEIWNRGLNPLIVVPPRQNYWIDVEDDLRNWDKPPEFILHFVDEDAQ